MHEQPTLLEEHFGIKPDELEYAREYSRTSKAVIIKLAKSLSRTVDIRNALYSASKQLNMNIEQKTVSGIIIPSWNYAVVYKKDRIVDLIQQMPDTQAKVCALSFPYCDSRELMGLQSDFLRTFDKTLYDMLQNNKKP